MNVATIVLATGERVSLDLWQQIYGLPLGSSKIGKFLSLGEPSIPQGTTLSAPLIQLFDQVRMNGWPASKINSGSRTHERQQELIANGERAASISPHEVFMAFDIDTTTVAESRKLVIELEKSADMLGIKIRIGIDDYIPKGYTMVHVDVTPEYYAPNKPYHDHKHPIQWETEKRW